MGEITPGPSPRFTIAALDFASAPDVKIGYTPAERPRILKTLQCRPIRATDDGRGTV